MSNEDTTTKPTTPTPKAKASPRTRGRKMFAEARESSLDTAGCVMHHIRVHHTLDSIIRKIVKERGLSFRDASEQALVDWAGKMGHPIVQKQTEVKTVSVVSVFVEDDKPKAVTEATEATEDEDTITL